MTLEAVDLHLMMAHKWPKPGNQERKDYYQFLFRYRPVEHMYGDLSQPNFGQIQWARNYNC